MPTKKESNPFTPIYMAFKAYRHAKKQNSIISKALHKKKSEQTNFIAGTTEINTKRELLDFTSGVEKLKLEVEALNTQNDVAHISMTEATNNLAEAIPFPNIKFPTSIPRHSWIMKSDGGNTSYKNEKKDDGKLIPIKGSSRSKSLKAQRPK